MILARIFTKIFKENGIILIDAKGQKYICGNPSTEKPITLKLLKENLNWKLLLDPELEFQLAGAQAQFTQSKSDLLISKLNYENIIGNIDDPSKLKKSSKVLQQNPNPQHSQDWNQSFYLLLTISLQKLNSHLYQISQLH